MNNQLDPEAFHCCYLLTSTNPKYINHTYIGYTVDPARRIRQHNGEIEGGATKTSRKRPWHMVLVVYGFCSQNAALRFEWAWQNPKVSLLTREAVAALEHVGNKDHVRAKLRVVYEMLNLLPFARYPLTVNFFNRDYHKYLENCPRHPSHIRIQTGSAQENLYAYRMKERLKLRELPQTDLDLASMCDVCGKDLPGEDDPNYAAECAYAGCAMRAHVVCLAQLFLHDQPQQLIPTTAPCPVCKGSLTWGAVVVERQKRKRHKLSSLNITF